MALKAQEATPRTEAFWTHCGFNKTQTFKEACCHPLQKAQTHPLTWQKRAGCAAREGKTEMPAAQGCPSVHKAADS